MCGEGVLAPPWGGVGKRCTSDDLALPHSRAVQAPPLPPLLVTRPPPKNLYLEVGPEREHGSSH